MQIGSLPRSICVFVLFSINLLNYIDRWTVAGVLTDMQQSVSKGGFGISDAEAGLLTSVFILTYMFFSPIFGYFGDRVNRNQLIFFGVTAWSSAVFLGSFATTFHQLLFCRGLVGIGEASYANVAPTLIADMYPIEERTRILSFYFVAVPLGSALGFILGGQASLFFGWRWAFRITPGFSFFLALLLCLFMREPMRGLSDGRILVDYNEHISPPISSDDQEQSQSETSTTKPVITLKNTRPRGAVSTPNTSEFSPESPSTSMLSSSVYPTELALSPTAHTSPVANAKSWLEDVKEVWSVRSFLWSTCGLTAVTFVMGALAQWGPAYLQRVSCSDLSEDLTAQCKSDINLIFGLISCVTGIGGTFLGSFLSSAYSTETNAVDAVLCAVGLLVASPFVFLGVYLAPLSSRMAWVMIFCGELMLGIIWVPVAAMLLYVISPLQRATASGMQTMFSHFFGDATSPVLVGYVADSLRSELVSRSDALRLALYPAALFCVIGGLCFLMATLFLADDRRTQNSVTPLNKSYTPLQTEHHDHELLPLSTEDAVRHDRRRR
eukprot:CAMPEP_0182446540 /NCGR_PEP_ID=MMETSP1172-20130603/4270_1 /TAXON_ID=708627 /ORGANISM="Timspurckia oligopyrenoides, Strain CCMP3278" /LENGTH=551 /DNA_ID=CAMNT_0024642491 /DNA_START=51 /DNA_END=1706 /DNA_ORIENTATION=-